MEFYFSGSRQVEDPADADEEALHRFLDFAGIGLQELQGYVTVYREARETLPSTST